MKVKIQPDNIEVEAQEGENLLEVISRAGVLIDASCGGKGVCGQCRVKIVKGEVDAQKGVTQSDEDWEEGWRQACLSKIKTDLEIFIPEDSRVEKEFILQKIRKPKGQFLTEDEVAQLNPDWKKESPVHKLYLELPPPSKEDNSTDLQRLIRGLRQKYGLRRVSVDFPALRRLPDVLREGDFKITATVVRTRGEEARDYDLQRGARRPKLIHIEAGDKRHRHFSVAFDIGTTTVSGQLLDLNRFEPIHKVNHFNAQIRFGADVISRIIYGSKPEGLAELQKAVVSTINGVLDELFSHTDIKREEISHMTCAGNTTMTHLFLGLNPKWIRLSPYVPVANIFPPVRAKELGINLPEWVHVYALPCVASYVGGDIVAGVLGAGIYKRSELVLYIDIGTNGEIVLGNQDWLLCASCSAGPAFEGGGIKYGTHAAPGAVERFSIDPDTCQVRYQTIGHKPAIGICGSGIINITAELLRVGLIDQNGKVNLQSSSPLVREGPDGPEVLIVPKEESGIGEDIVLREMDFDNLIRAKAAMYAGYRTLLGEVGLDFENLELILIAGNFGSYLDIENAITIGLLPDIDRDKIRFIGNGSLLGARLVSFSNELLDDAEKIAQMMTNIELADNMTFMDNYMAALFLPHTEEKFFPSVMERIQKWRQRKLPCVPIFKEVKEAK